MDHRLANFIPGSFCGSMAIDGVRCKGGIGVAALEDGSWLVRVSLARNRRWIVERGLGIEQRFQRFRMMIYRRKINQLTTITPVGKLRIPPYHADVEDRSVLGMISRSARHWSFAMSLNGVRL
jgi:hypothetical protein